MPSRPGSSYAWARPGSRLLDQTALGPPRVSSRGSRGNQPPSAHPDPPVALGPALYCLTPDRARTACARLPATCFTRTVPTGRVAFLDRRMRAEVRLQRRARPAATTPTASVGSSRPGPGSTSCTGSWSGSTRSAIRPVAPGRHRGDGCWPAAPPSTSPSGSWLRRSERLAVLPRATLDAVDATVWSFAPYPDGYWDFAVLPGVALGIEAGLGSRWKGMVVPAGERGADEPVRRGPDPSPVQAAPFLWQALAVVSRRRVQPLQPPGPGRHRAASEGRLAAKEASAMLAGQNAVAMGADTVIDQVQSVAPLFGRPVPGSALHELVDGWKAALAEATQHSAAYLGTVLTAWQRSHNTHPDLLTAGGLRRRRGRRNGDADRPAGRGAAADADEPEPQGPARRSGCTTPTTAGQRPGDGSISTSVVDSVSVPPDPDIPPRSPDFGPVGLLVGACLLGPTGDAHRRTGPVPGGSPADGVDGGRVGVAEVRLRQRRLARPGRGPAHGAGYLRGGDGARHVHGPAAVQAIRRPELPLLLDAVGAHAPVRLPAPGPLATGPPAHPRRHGGHRRQLDGCWRRGPVSSVSSSWRCRGRCQVFLAGAQGERRVPGRRPPAGRVASGRATARRSTPPSIGA